MMPEGLPVKGYGAQTDDRVAIVNANKELEERVLRACEAISENPEFDEDMAVRAHIQIQQAFMWLNRAVFQPGRVTLPEDKDS